MKGLDAGKGVTATAVEKLLKAKSEAKAAARTAWGSATAYMLVYAVLFTCSC